MVYVLKFWLLLVASCAHQILIKCEREWSIDIVSIKTENKRPDVAFVDAYVTRPRRGVFALGGVFEWKKDIPEEALFSSTVHYSVSGSTFIKTPFEVPPTSLTRTMRIYYREFLMDDLLNCSDNAPRVDDKFVPPLRKFTMHLYDCIISNDNFPSKMKSGYYKIMLYYKNFWDVTVEVLAEIYQN